jgi:hypothetical protein
MVLRMSHHEGGRKVNNRGHLAGTARAVSDKSFNYGYGTTAVIIMGKENVCIVTFGAKRREKRREKCKRRRFKQRLVLGFARFMAGSCEYNKIQVDLGRMRGLNKERISDV